MKTIITAFHWLFSLLAIPFTAAYKAVKAGVIHIFDEVDRLFNIAKKDITMTVEAKLDQIIAALATLAAPAAPDLSGLATSASVAELSAKVDALTATVGTETPVTPPAA